MPIKYLYSPMATVQGVMLNGVAYRLAIIIFYCGGLSRPVAKYDQLIANYAGMASFDRERAREYVDELLTFTELEAVEKAMSLFIVDIKRRKLELPIQMPRIRVSDFSRFGIVNRSTRPIDLFPKSLAPISKTPLRPDITELCSLNPYYRGAYRPIKGVIHGIEPLGCPKIDSYDFDFDIGDIGPPLDLNLRDALDNGTG